MDLETFESWEDGSWEEPPQPEFGGGRGYLTVTGQFTLSCYNCGLGARARLGPGGEVTVELLQSAPDIALQTYRVTGYHGRVTIPPGTYAVVVKYDAGGFYHDPGQTASMVEVGSAVVTVR